MNPLLSIMRGTKLLMRSTAALTAALFCFVFYFSPAALAINAEITKDKKYLQQLDQLQETTPDQKLSHRLQKLKNLVGNQIKHARQEREENAGFMRKALNWVVTPDPVSSAEKQELQALSAAVKEAYADAIKGMEQDAQKLKTKKLPAVALKRQAAALAAVKKQYAQLQAELQPLLTTKDATKQTEHLQRLTTLLDKTQFKRSHNADDPKKLSWGRPHTKHRAPVINKQDLQAALGVDDLQGKPQLAGAYLSPALLNAAVLAARLPAPADLQPTIDAPVTPAIQTLADSLNHNVVQIYTWVHNNIRFIPSYGSIQGADMTLATKRGNAMDTASLTIALLRASGIPARYAYGTVELPIEQVKNWVGGAQDTNAALGVLANGGIPSVGVISGGVIKKVRMEHTWVEAWVDFEPSRGMQNGAGDSWIKLDPSFKQYEFTQGMDLNQAVPFDAQGLLDELEKTATVNEAEGWVQNVPEAVVSEKITAYQQQLQNYIENQNPDATVADVLGLQKINVLPPQPLAAGLPYKHILTSQQFSEVPNKLRHRFQYNIAIKTQGYAGDPVISLDEPTVKLAGKKLALSFTPATQDDADIIASYIPEPDPQTGEINPADLPDSLPGYLINLKAELSLDGEIIASASIGSMGSELHEELGFWDPQLGWDLVTNSPIAGEYQAIGLDLQGTNPAYAAKLQADLNATKAALESQDINQLSQLNKHQLVGDLLQATIFSYFALNNLQDELTAQQAGVLSYRAPSFGKFSTKLNTRFWFGTPRNVSMAGLQMDVDKYVIAVNDKKNQTSNAVNYMQVIGSRGSAMEHLVPEQMFSTPEAPAQGISAVKALAIASALGQKIWTITQDNLDIAMAALQLDADSKAEIRAGVLAGNVVTAHEKPINFNGWVGEGYTIIDPQTGAGAYKIAGGGNGSNTKLTKAGKILKFTGLIPQFNAIKYAGALAASSLTVSMFGAFNCQYENIAQVGAALLAVGAFIMFSRTIIAMLAIPELAVFAQQSVRGVISTAFALLSTSIGTANAAESLPDECECASGIESYEEGYRQCWICKPEERYPMRRRISAAKGLTNSLGGCMRTAREYTYADLAERSDAWDELADARDAENACWYPQGVNHVGDSETARKNARNCRAKMTEYRK